MPKVFQIRAEVSGDGLKVGAPDDMTEEDMLALVWDDRSFRDSLLQKLRFDVTDIQDDTDILNMSECWHLVSDSRTYIAREEAVDWLPESDQ